MDFGFRFKYYSYAPTRSSGRSTGKTARGAKICATPTIASTSRGRKVAPGPGVAVSTPLGSRGRLYSRSRRKISSGRASSSLTPTPACASTRRFRVFPGTVRARATSVLRAGQFFSRPGPWFLHPDVPKGVLHVTIPLQARAPSASTPRRAVGFERMLIIADEGSYVHYVEGCTAPIY